jgi:hypothetical protein
MNERSIRRTRTLISVITWIIAVALSFSSRAFATTAGWNGRILFLNGNEIATVKPDGSGLTTIATPPPGCRCSYEDPAGTADGRIAVIRGAAAGGSELLIMDPDGTIIKNLGSGFRGTVRNPTWSPDGSQIAFEDEGIFGFPSTISVINTDGTGLKMLLTTGGFFSQPAWSPDGKRIAVVANDLSPGSGTHISIVNADGTGLTPLTTGKSDVSPTWSPDGTQIAFLSERDIFRIKVDGTGLTNLTNGVESHAHPSWSPDGTSIAFNTGTASVDLWTMSAVDGSGRVPVTFCDCSTSADWQSWVDTSLGSGVIVFAGGSPNTVTFDNVIAAGITTVTRPTSCPLPPAGFQIGSPPACYDVETTASFTGTVEVCLSYAGVTFPPGTTPVLSHGELDADGITLIWKDVTTLVDTVNQIVCGKVSSLSPFAILGTSTSNQPPVAMCRNVTKSAGPVCSADVTTGEVNDGSSDPDGDPIAFSLNPAGPFALGATSVVLTVTDDEGSSSQCNATITVVDDTAPTITCPPDVAVSNTPGLCSANVTINPDAAVDNCSTPTVSGARSDAQPLAAAYPVGTTVIIWTATDGAGNQSACAQRITVRDTTAPSISVSPARMVVIVPAVPAPRAALGLPSPVVSDACDPAPAVTDDAPASFSTGVHTITFRASDHSGNSAQAQLTVEVLLAFGSFAVRAEAELSPRPNRDKFEARALFRLGSGHDGLDPARDVLRFRASGGSARLTIDAPLSAFRADRRGRLRFEGLLDGHETEIRLRPLRDGGFRLDLEVKGLNLAGLRNPLAVELRIGDDIGRTATAAEIGREREDRERRFVGRARR